MNIKFIKAEPSDGLKNRRNMEWNLFEKGEYCFGNQCFENMENK